VPPDIGGHDGSTGRLGLDRGDAELLHLGDDDRQRSGVQVGQGLIAGAPEELGRGAVP
jgi:hypothetical protein